MAWLHHGPMPMYIIHTTASGASLDDGLQPTAYTRPILLGSGGMGGMGVTSLLPELSALTLPFLVPNSARGVLWLSPPNPAPNPSRIVPAVSVLAADVRPVVVAVEPVMVVA
jgi:hypothetical protein